MPSTRRQKAKARRSREMDMMSDFEKMDVVLGNENANPIERELTDTIHGSVSINGLESYSHIRRNPSNEKEIRDFSHKGEVPKQDRILESIQTFSNKINMRLSQEMDAMMSMMHSQNKRAISSAFSERVIPEIQSIISSISSGNRDTESGSSSNNHENNTGTTGFKTKITKKECRSAFDLRDTEDLSPYIYSSFVIHIFVHIPCRSLTFYSSEIFTIKVCSVQSRKK